MEFAEGVFGCVTKVQEDALEVHRSAAAREASLTSRDIAGLGPRIKGHLSAGQGLVVGLGLIVAPDVLEDEPLRLEWWQSEPGQEEPAALQVDLNRLSLGFYDYERAEWFDVPRRSGVRHIVGPYVDVHGTGQYILTFTVPIVVEGQFLGVAGADVPTTWLESRLLSEVGTDLEVVVLNADGRVVLSTASRFLVGELVPVAVVDAEDFRPLPRLPWRFRTARFAKPLTSQV